MVELEDVAYYKGDEFSGEEDPRYSDREFILSEIKKAPFWARNKVLAKYSSRYVEILNDRDIAEHVRVGVARSECNKRLRQAVINLTSPSMPLSVD